MRRITIIAEAGVNHNGDPAIATELIDIAAEAGADYVKFQTFTPERLVTVSAAKALYQERETGAGESQLAMLKRLELKREAHAALVAHCEKKRIGFLSTPFDSGSLDFLAHTLGLPLLKIGSGEVTNGPLLVQAARTGRNLILSTGMADLAEVEAALSCLAFGYVGNGEPGRRSFREAFLSPEGRARLEEKVTLLHCTTEYPAPFSEVNLMAMVTLRETFGLKTGYSDHTPGIAIACAAAALGASVLEKHFTVSRPLSGPDHNASLKPEELGALVRAVREIEAALGDGVKRPSPSESRNKKVARKSLVVSRSVRAGELFTESNLTSKRPGEGTSPMDFWEWEGKPAPRDYAEDEAIP